jgi:hypothetical protein
MFQENTFLETKLNFSQEINKHKKFLKINKHKKILKIISQEINFKKQI